jgi:N,N'-diacetylchitobiose transport system substrate-binding protein
VFGQRIGAATAAIALALVAAACGGGDDEGGGTTGAATQAAAGGSKLEGEITTWIMGAKEDPGAAVVMQQAKSFETANPGTKVKVDFISWPQAHDKFTTSIAGGQVPDVAEVGTTWTPEFAALGAFVEQEKPAEGEYVSSLVDAGTVDGKFYGKPWYAGARAYFYRTDVFEKAGVKPPTTWEEWEQVNAAIKQKGGGIAPIGLSASADAIHSFLPMVWQAGGEIAEQDGDKWVSRMDSSEAVQAMDFYAGMYKKGYSPKASISWTGIEAEKAFITGQVASFIGVGWNIGDIQKQAPNLKWATAPMPAGPAGKRTVFAGGSHLAVFEGSKNPELAKAFVDYMAKPENVSSFADKVGLVPGTVAAIEQGPFTQHEYSGVMAKGILEDSKSYPPTEHWGPLEGSKIFDTAIQDVMAGRKTAEQAGKTLAAEMNKEFGA